jgi:hypothetical protein
MSEINPIMSILRVMRDDTQSPAIRWAFCYLPQSLAIVRGFFVLGSATPISPIWMI